jgi:hypothetical protein
MASQVKMREDLEDLLARCSPTEAGMVTRAETIELLLGAMDAPLPARLERFLEEAAAHPEHSAEAAIAMAATMQDFGARVFRRLLTTALMRRKCESDAAQNSDDLFCAELLLRTLGCECSNTPYMPPGVAELLGRIASALRDVRTNSSRPKMFTELVPLEGRTPPPDATARVECEGRLAAVLHIVILGGMKLAEAKVWLDEEMRKAGLVDVAGNPISVERVAGWRKNFSSDQAPAARYGREWFELEIEDHKAVLRAPSGNRKLAACQDHARRLVGLLARHFNRTVPRPQEKH